MCNAIDLPGVSLHTIEEVRAFGWKVLPGDAEPFEDGEPWPEDACFCGVHVEAILERNVYGRWRKEPWGYIVDPPQPGESEAP